MAPISHILRHVREEAGTILVFWALMLAALMGLVALSFDIGRIASTQSELQSFADSVALAAAGELDGSDEAIARARRAAEELVERGQTFAAGERLLSGEADYTLTFYPTLPPDDRTAMTGATTDPARARYVRAVVTPREVGTPFAAALRVLTGGAAGGPAQVGAVAVAGFTMYACDITPLMFCVPSSDWKANANVGTQIKLRAGGNGAAWGPGNFGFLDPAILEVDPAGPCGGLNGAQLFRCLVGAEDSITGCVRTDAGVDTQPGQRQGLAEAFNTRFDHFQGSMQKFDSDRAYRPAPNTVQGTLPTGGMCRKNNVLTFADGDINTMPLPRDTVIDCESCDRFGDGNWNRSAYVTQNHGGVYPSGTDPTSSRYEMYLAEVATAQSNGGQPLPGMDETGEVMCHTLGPSPDVNRRNVIAAAIDCDANNIQGSTQNVVPLEFVELFMTEPVRAPGGGEDAEIMVEVLGSAGGGAGGGGPEGSFHEVVQLYR